MIKQCVICGKEFEASKYNRNSQKYCSKECRLKRNAEYDRQRKRGERENFQKRSKSTYSKDRTWTPALERFFTKFSILLRGG